MLNAGDVEFVLGVAHRSAATLESIAAAAFCAIAARFVCTPIGSNAKTEIRQRDATPRATATSTSEKPVKE
jgi:hypothetical protein